MVVGARVRFADLPGDWGIPHCGCGPHVIHTVKVLALSAPQCRPPLLLANATSRSRSPYAIAVPSVCRLSVCRSSVCNVGAPYSVEIFGNFSSPFNWYLGHPLTPTEKFTEIVPGEPLRRGFKRKRGSEI